MKRPRAVVGKLDKTFDEAREHGWTVADMKRLAPSSGRRIGRVTARCSDEHRRSEP
jgi:hypothetical protein